MKKVKYLIYGLLFSLLSAALASSQALDVKTLEYIDSLVNSSYHSYGPGLSLMIAKDGLPLYKKAYGMADIELNVPLSTENVFAIGSMTKQFTAVCILQLVSEGKLNLNDEINKFLPDYNSHGSVITIENCLTHTSGIPSFTEKKNFDTIYQKRLSEKEMLGFFQEDELLFEPGSDFSYSNSGYYILGVIIKNVSGVSYEEYVQKNIFDKAGMRHSYFESNVKIIPMRASGYDGEDSSNYQNASYYERSWAMGAGNIMSTTGDLLLWSEALYSGKMVSHELLRKAVTPFRLKNGNITNYGYGWNITPLDKYTVIRHGGAINGYLSDAVWVPEKHMYIVMLSNTTGKSLDPVMEKIAMKILNVSDAPPVIEKADKSSFQEYIGAYEVNRDGGRLLRNFSNEKQYRYIFTEGDSLMLQRTGGAKLALLQYGKDKFFTSGSDKRFDFIRDGSGNVTALDVYNYPLNFGPTDICLKVEGVSLPAEKKETEVPEEVMKTYTGEYEVMPGFNLKIFIENGKLFTQPTGQEKIQLYPESITKFFIKIVDAQVEFLPEPDGSVNKLILTQGQKFECVRIK